MIEAAGLMIKCEKTDRLLFVKRGAGSDFAGCWHFPGGRLEDGETPEMAAQREVVEEVGPCPHDNPQIWTHQINDDPTDYLKPVSYTTFIAGCRDEFRVVLNWENTAWAWALPNDPPLPLHPGCEAALRKLTGETIEEELSEFAEDLEFNREFSIKLDAIVSRSQELAAKWQSEQPK